MEKKVKTILYIFLIIIFSFCLIYYSGELKRNEVLAAGGNSASNLQLMARAINGEARGEGYEGQVAVRSSNNE